MAKPVAWAMLPSSIKPSAFTVVSPLAARRLPARHAPSPSALSAPSGAPATAPESRGKPGRATRRAASARHPRTTAPAESENGRSWLVWTRNSLSAKIRTRVATVVYARSSPAAARTSRTSATVDSPRFQKTCMTSSSRSVSSLAGGRAMMILLPLARLDRHEFWFSSSGFIVVT